MSKVDKALIVYCLLWIAMGWALVKGCTTEWDTSYYEYEQDYGYEDYHQVKPRYRRR